MERRFAYERYSEFYNSRYGNFVQSLDVIGPYTLIDAQQEAGNLSGAATHEMFIARTMSRGSHVVDFGNGAKKEYWNPGDYSICPTEFNNTVISDTPHRVQILSIYYPKFNELISENNTDFSGDFQKMHSRQKSGIASRNFFLTLCFIKTTEKISCCWKVSSSNLSIICSDLQAAKRRPGPGQASNCQAGPCGSPWNG